MAQDNTSSINAVRLGKRLYRVPMATPALRAISSSRASSPSSPNTSRAAGLATARRFGEEGFQVALVCRSGGRIKSVVDERTAEGLRVKGIIADLAGINGTRTLSPDWAGWRWR